MYIQGLGEEDAEYAMRIMNMIKLFGKPIKVNKASVSEKDLDVGANLFVVILRIPKHMLDMDTGNFKGYAFINFASLVASDAALEAMNGQYLCNGSTTCSYAYKKDAKGKRHGTAAERLLAAQNPVIAGDKSHQMFAELPPIPPAAAIPNLMGILVCKISHHHHNLESILVR
uniref:RRM domain-containing protein n=1 Tax=Panagrolaimus sp. PS1159 TaxID=55785 RepID=A0AC35GRB9_9BILA